VIYFSTFGVFFLPFWKMILWSALGGSATILGVKAVILMKTNPPRQGVAHQLTTK
jgi:hypothetical protein